VKFFVDFAKNIPFCFFSSNTLFWRYFFCENWQSLFLTPARIFSSWKNRKKNRGLGAKK
jgi:hypothetical protein